MYDLNITGFTTESELKQIEEWASSVEKNGVIVEIGSYLGRSSIAWALSCDPSVKVFCIDQFGTNIITNISDFEIFNKNTQHIKNIIPIKGSSPHDIVYPGLPIDIFFLDAAHTNPSDLDNLEYFIPFIKQGGLLCGHDYNTGAMPPAIEENILMLEKKFNQSVKLYPETTLWSFRM